MKKHFQFAQQPEGQKGYSPGRSIFGCDTILMIKHRVDWELICQRKYTQINRDNVCENKYRVDCDYKVRGKVMLANHTE